ncbi:MAG: DUF3857 domain-containing protein [Bacteroidales bacterium]|nr:DUF3857 domain-containing protein [Bacteroidales bacterium]
MKKVLVVLLLFPSIFLSSQESDGKFLNGAANPATHATILQYDQDFEILSSSRSILRVHKKIRIENKFGDFFGILALFYNKYLAIKNIYGTINDQQANKIKKLKRGDVKDVGAISGMSLFDDIRYKYYEPYASKYPYIVEYGYEIHFSGSLNYPVWNPVYDYNLEVRNAKFNVICPDNLDFRFKEYNFNGTFKKNNEKNKKIYTWRISEFKALENDPFGLDMSELTPSVRIAPNEFVQNGYKGSMETWIDFGNWISSLAEEGQDISENTKNDLEGELLSKENMYEKVAFLHSYLLKNTRYVSIQEGLGGWKPFDVEQVDHWKYGDCKALSNYMIALLNYAGITAHYTLIKAGKNVSFFRQDFPSNQFNHAIVAVPAEDDTIWLECTNKYSPAGYLGLFTYNRDALVITKDTSFVCRTPVLNEKNNILSSVAECNILDESVLSVRTKSTYSGYMVDNMMQFLFIENDEKKKWLYKYIDLPDFTISDYKFDYKRERIPQLELSLDISLESFITKIGRKIYIPAIITINEIKTPANVYTRTSPVLHKFSYALIDTIIYSIPEKYSLDFIPENVAIHEEFGDFSLRFEKSENDLTVIREINMKKGRWPKDCYSKLVGFYQKISETEKLQFSIEIE